MIPSNEISHILSYLNEETTNYKSSFDIVSVVNLIDRIIRNNYNLDGIQSNLYSIADKILSLQSILQLQDAQKTNGSIVK
jgi:phenylalanine-4-hydroxylase